MDLTEIVHFDHSQRHPWELARLEIIKSQVVQLLSEHPSNENTSILDIGCGDAFLVGNLAKYFPTINFVGIDINFTQDQIMTLQSQFEGTNLTILKTLDEVSLADNTVSIVLLLDVIEHIEDEISFMQNLKNYTFLGEQTKYLITVPAFQGLFAAHDVILGHFRRYSNQVLRQRLHTAGYETQSARYFFFSLLPPRLLQVILEKIAPRDVTTGSDLAAWRGNRFVTNFIKEFLLFDYRFSSAVYALGLNLPGLSNLAICQRSA